MAQNPDYIPPLGQQGDEGDQLASNFPPAAPAPEPVPPPPAISQDYGVRTMSGDVNSLESSGGLGAEPKTFRPRDLLKDEPVFSPQDPQSSRASQQPQMPPLSESKHHSKALVISIGAVTGLIILGAAAYFIFFRSPAETVPPSEPPAPPVEPVTPPVEPTPPPVEPVPPVEPPPPPPAPAFQHQSFFPAASNVASVNVALSSLSATDISAAISSAFTAEARVPVLKEMVFASGSNNVNAREFLTGLIPTLNSAFLEARLDMDFTAWGYKDKDGVWPGYVFRFNPAPTGEAKPDIFPLLEQSSANFYISSPGAPKNSDFRSGAKFSQNIRDIRYLPYTSPGASFNIAWVVVGGTHYAVVSTSFDGLKEAMRLLNF